MTFFRQFLHANANFSDRNSVSMSPKNSNLHAKTVQKWQVALFIYFCLSEPFATLYAMQARAVSTHKTSKEAKVIFILENYNYRELQKVRTDRID